MPFLLLLSAILTALTGAVTGARPVEIAVRHQALAANVQRVAAAAAPLFSGHAHLLGDFGVAAAFALTGSAPLAPTAAPRLYLDRPRA